MKEIGLIGLGKIGKLLAKRLCAGGIKVTAYDISPNTAGLKKIKGMTIASSIKNVVKNISPRRTVWIMVPAGNEVDKIIKELLESGLKQRDIIIDGGNSDFRDSIRRSEYLKEKNISYLDIGTSGGTRASENGFCLMAGGDKKTYKEVKPAIELLACKGGYLYTGKSGSGHFVKMVHNAIEYGMMQSISEGFELLSKGPYQDSLELEKIARLWTEGSIIRSFLIELTADALSKDPGLLNVKGYAEDSGEARWAIREAINFDVPFESITHSLFARISSRQDESFAAKMISVLRNEFGGHNSRKK